ncbi:hypothetical protein JMN10_06760 [Capnocytophaga genosp. AHN8471]|uniref:Uncharacterized protein n=2 Tax=Capnocytophaga TaxID=1016 RepID=A0ABS1YWA7_9FLAO|nr:hypothetical protein [Capnocytophaga genosp. AHN8471]MBM0650695.1 hypothetical protein [Capnocytophaga genosp. AHN8471]MBM0661883.1 hypothetical protein [Capnocytophaga genosp. AHN8471]
MKPLQLSDFTVDPNDNHIYQAEFEYEEITAEIVLTHEKWDFNRVFKLSESVFANLEKLNNKAKSFLAMIEVGQINEQLEEQGGKKITEEDFKNLTPILKINICDGEIQFYYLMVLGEYFLGVQMSAEDDFNNPNFLYLSIETTLESDAEGQKIFKATDISVYEVTIESAEKKSPSSTSNNFLQVYDNKNFFERIVSFFKGLFK